MYVSLYSIPKVWRIHHAVTCGKEKRDAKLVYFLLEWREETKFIHRVKDKG